MCAVPFCRCKCICIFGAYINSISVERTSKIAKRGAGRVLCFKNVVKVDTNHEAETNKKPSDGLSSRHIRMHI